MACRNIPLHEAAAFARQKCSLYLARKSRRGRISGDATKKLSPADEMDDLEAVVGLDRGFFPPCAGEDIEVAFNRHATARHAEVFEQRRDRQAIGNFAAVSIDRYRHRGEPIGCVLGRARIVKRSSSVPESVLAKITSARPPF